jgi:hypothetical protein
MLDEAETGGRVPLFVDAFYDHAKPLAHVILNMKTFAKPTKSLLHAWGVEMEWTCEWTAPDASQAKRVASLRGYTNLYAHASKIAEFPVDPPRSDAELSNATVEANFKDISAEGIAPHWAMVVSCPTISALKGSSSVRLNLRGKYKGAWFYGRLGIPVSESRFVKRGVESAICTMVNRGNLSKAEYLKPWAQYHLAVGFSQLLVYVEEKDTSWVEDALRNFINKDQVAIVPFYFGNISDQNDFLMQGAMESHCLYQARGMAKWIAHMDVDEYFDFIRSDVNMRSYQLPKSDSSDVVLVARNQFWGVMPSSHRVDSPYPCHLNGKSKYIHDLYRRSKLIMRPEYIDALFPHYVMMDRTIYTEMHPDPTSELRLNHFKGCDTSGHGCYGNLQYGALHGDGKKELETDDSGWTGRCEAILSVEQ